MHKPVFPPELDPDGAKQQALLTMHRYPVRIEEINGRWLAMVPRLPGIRAWADSPIGARRELSRLALDVLTRPVGLDSTRRIR